MYVSHNLSAFRLHTRHNSIPPFCLLQMKLRIPFPLFSFLHFAKKSCTRNFVVEIKDLKWRFSVKDMLMFKLCWCFPGSRIDYSIWKEMPLLICVASLKKISRKMYISNPYKTTFIPIHTFKCGHVLTCQTKLVLPTLQRSKKCMKDWKMNMFRFLSQYKILLTLKF